MVAPKCPAVQGSILRKLKGKKKKKDKGKDGRQLIMPFSCSQKSVRAVSWSGSYVLLK